MRNRLICYLGMMLLAFNCSAADPQSEFAKANHLYQQKSFDSATAVYEQLIAQQYLAPEVYYNLGNCYYKTGNMAKALLSYERALKYQPGDEDILFNIRIAQLKTVDKIETVPEIFYVRWAQQLASAFSADQWAFITVILAWCVCIAAAVYLLSLRVPVKRAGFILSIVFLVLMLGSWYITQQNYIAAYVNKNAIVMSPSVYVKSSPGENNTDLFLLHEGTKISVLDTYEDWLKIRIANGSVGWIRQGEVEEI